MESSPLAEMVKTVPGHHQTQHQVLLDLKMEQDQHCCLLLRARTVFIDPHQGVHEPETCMNLFEKTAEACGWSLTQWLVCLIPLLSGEAQVAAQQLPLQNLLA